MRGIQSGQSQSSIVNRNFDDRSQPPLAQVQERVHADAHVRLRDSGRHAAGAGVLSSGQARFQFDQLGVLHPTAQARRRNRRRHGQRHRRNLHSARAGRGHRRAGRRARRRFSFRIRRDQIELVDPFRRGHSQRRAVHHLGHRRLWRCWSCRCTAFPRWPAAWCWA